MRAIGGIEHPYGVAAVGLEVHAEDGRDERQREENGRDEVQVVAGLFRPDPLYMK